MKRLLIMFLAIMVVGGLVVGGVIVTCADGSPVATRSLPSSVEPGANFDVDIAVSDYGPFGQVVETLPAGFGYVGSTLSEAAVTVEGQVAEFTLLGDTAFSYTLTASSTEDTYTFSGVLKDEDRVEYVVGGDTQIRVSRVAVATRSLPSSVGAGANFDVGVAASDYGAFGQVVETLPTGFSYAGSSLSAAAVTVEGQVVEFILLGDTSFSYTLTASSTDGAYTFSGILKDEDKVEYTVGGDTQITVTSAATPTPTLTPTPTPRPRPAPTPTPTSIPPEEQVIIEAPEGGAAEVVEPGQRTQVSTPDGDLVLDIPWAFVEEPTQVVVAPIDPSEAPAPTAGRHVLRALSITAYDLFGNEITVVSGVPAQLTVSYTDDDLQLVGGDPTRLLVMRYVPDRGWVTLRTTVDTERRVLTVNITTFSMFALGGQITLGDINVDGVVNYLDLAILGASYGTSEGDPLYRPGANLNGDGSVDLLDLAILAANYGTGR